MGLHLQIRLLGLGDIDDGHRCERLPDQGYLYCFFGPLPEHLEGKEPKDPPLTMSVPLFLVIGGSVVFGLYPRILH